MNFEIIFIVCVVHFVFDFIGLFFIVKYFDDYLVRLFDALNELCFKIRALDRDIVNSGSLSDEVLQQREDDKRCKKILEDYLEEMKKK